MAGFSDWWGERNRKSWRRLSFTRSASKVEVLAREQATSQRVVRALVGVVAALAAAAIVCLGQFSMHEPWVLAGAVGVVLLVHHGLHQLLRAYHHELRLHVRDFARYLLLLTLFLGLGRVILESDLSPYLCPVPALAMVLAIVFGGQVAIMGVAVTSVLIGLMAGAGQLPGQPLAPALTLAATQFLGGLVAAIGVVHIRNRTKLLTVGTTCGLVQLVCVMLSDLWVQDVPQSLARLIDPGWALFNGVAAGILVTSALPFIERWFDITTDMRLIELADQNHPLLREFSLLAPGSFMHSLMVGQLAEEAALSIGANDLLARVGAYYHDIGKMMKPNYFVENMRDGDNVHDRLSPEMSRLIIISHVKDGIRIAQEEGLPRPIIDMIPMHHGTSVVEYFYHKKRQQEEEAGRAESGQEAFQYPGPRPTFREAGILMLADSVEATSRVLHEPTPARLRQVVRTTIQKKMTTGQLDECDLTMHDLKGIEDAFVRVLTSIHHGRIRYPGDDDARGSGARAARSPESGLHPGMRGGTPSDPRDRRSRPREGDAPPPGGELPAAALAEPQSLRPRPTL